MTTPRGLLPEEVNLINAINQFRIQNKRVPLLVSAALTNSARWQANDMATHNYLGHTDSLGRNPFQRMAAFGYTYSTTKGENVAAGSPSGQVTFEQWNTSCDPNAAGVCTYAHRAIMLDPTFRVIGVARAYNASSTYKYYWVADFGGFVDTTIPLPSAATVAPGVTVAPTLPTPQAQNAAGESVTPTAPAPTKTTIVTVVTAPPNNAPPPSSGAGISTL